MNRKFCISYTINGKLLGDEVYAKDTVEALEIGKALHGATCEVDGQLVAEIDGHDETDAKYYDDDGNEISEEEWKIT